MLSAPIRRPVLTTAALRRWLPQLLRRAPYLATAYLVPGRVDPRLREATMLGVTSINRCHACDMFHRRWARTVGLAADDPRSMAPAEVAAYAYGQAIAIRGPRSVPPPGAPRRRHRHELEAAALLMEIANLAGNRFLPERAAREVLQIDGPLVARAYDRAMGLADRAGLARARRRTAGGAAGRVLEIGIGTGLNLAHYPRLAELHGIDPSAPALDVTARRSRRLARPLTTIVGDAAALPYPDDSFDAVVGTFVLCSVGDVQETLRESRRVLRPGGTLRILEHARSRHGLVARLQAVLAPGWARVAGGCRLDHDVRDSLEQAGLRVIESRATAGGVIVEFIASA